ncbi:hypothetical protein, partial [Sphingosinicella sp.]|uniref:hypothetical protein n=1 Tax=Sphingosinicella sp. TaxID=1917971 RepID=UPI0026044A70
SFATQAYPKITVTTRATGRTLKRNIESARPASSANLTSYTTSWDATGSRGSQVRILSPRPFSNDHILSVANPVRFRIFPFFFHFFNY